MKFLRRISKGNSGRFFETNPGGMKKKSTKYFQNEFSEKCML